MQPMGRKSADSGVENHPHPIQGSNSSRHSLAAQLWALLQPLTQTRLLQRKTFWAMGKKARTPAGKHGDVA